MSIAKRTILAAWLASALSIAAAADQQVQAESFYGTLEPFASDAVYFVLTDRFVNGDPTNDQREQGGANRTFDRPTPNAPPGQTDNIGYLGGDFRGILDHADYIRDMGFSAVWITPIVDNPDEAFTGGDPVTWKGFMQDGGKTGYHGYWGVNFWQVDEHLPSAGLGFAEFTKQMRRKGLKTVLDIVANHGSPSFTMPTDQPKYGEIYDREGKLVADHQNLTPEQLQPKTNPLHAFFHTKNELVQLSDLDEDNPAVREYLTGAYLQWIEQGADAFRIDTIRHVSMPFWAEFSRRVRAQHPGFFMFGEAYDYEAKHIAPYTQADKAAVSVLDFPLKQGLDLAFGKTQAGYEVLDKPLFLGNGPYQNAYDLMTFYDNHDMARLNATDAGFIDAHNWLFTARGIPVVYYGSEIGFMRGTAEHEGNRNYFGTDNVQRAQAHPIRAQLARVAKLRGALPALQRGLQVNLQLKGNQAAFLRVFQHGQTAQQVLVLLNKGDGAASFALKRLLQSGSWREVTTAAALKAPALVEIDGRLDTTVPAHDLKVYVLDAPVTLPALRSALRSAMRRKSGE
ncbi:cyclomaltodextrin glucanotransferase [Ahniella affigens]|uniref:Cyclomaltodextrin glucanotransferase n=1 Tax=Ahniella affigens TaxID=2021234 RepID=A0A2P1PTV3_9GAMM|nr:alpha-amylase family glycosyl hydrolase [Ahniella affigens]AVP98260.1 cyclomaltodextrin glucanotransferase [Ahniella affigens]